MNKDFFLGTVIDNYRLTKVLGGGGFANVYLGVNRDTGKKAAIKIAKSWLHHREPVTQTISIRKIINEAKPLFWFSGPGFKRVKMTPWEINQVLEKEGETLEKITHPSFVKVLGKRT